MLVDDANGIIAGHGRVEAAKILGKEVIPTVRLSQMSEAEVRAYVIADNKLAENAGWDEELLALELQGLIEFDLDFDVTLTGFEMPEIDILIGGLDESQTNAPDPADEAPDVEQGPAVTREGDVWQIGSHPLMCGDATEAETFDRLLGFRAGADGVHRPSQ